MTALPRECILIISYIFKSVGADLIFEFRVVRVADDHFVPAVLDNFGIIHQRSGELDFDADTDLAARGRILAFPGERKCDLRDVLFVGAAHSLFSEKRTIGGADVFLDQLCDQSELSPVLDRTDPSK